MNKYMLSILMATLLLATACQNPSSSDSTPTTYAVTYAANTATGGIVPSSVEYEAAAKVTVAGNTGSLAKGAYGFNGWNTSADGTGTAYAVGSTFTMPANAVTLYAQWALLPTYTISYTAPDATGGTIPTDGTLYLSGSSAVVLAGVPTRTDYLFDGWTITSDGSGTLYKAGDYITFGSANVTLYAKWLPKHMTFDCYDGFLGYGVAPTAASVLRFSFASYGTTTGKFVLTSRNGTVYTGSYTDTGAIARTANSGYTTGDTGYTLAFDSGYTATVHLRKQTRTSDGAVVYGIYSTCADVVYASGNQTTFNTDLDAIFGTAVAQWTPWNVTTY